MFPKPLSLMDSYASSTRSSGLERESVDWSNPDHRSSGSTFNFNDNVYDYDEDEVVPTNPFARPSNPKPRERPPVPSPATKPLAFRKPSLPSNQSPIPRERSPSRSPSPVPKVQPLRPTYGDIKKLRTVIAVDYGTTFTSTFFLAFTPLT